MNNQDFPGRLALPGTSIRLSERNPAEYLVIVRLVLPEKYELFLRIVEDRELWPLFREKAAEVFCMGDKAYLLKNIRPYPLCFAHIGAERRSVPDPWHHEKLRNRHYTYCDLAELAETMTDGTERSES